ncbi:MAG: glycosyltransferase family 4 protein [Bdellovibrionales bacterium]|nr:glycosyltransferase family 4 protein [Bdellovibrionales bacterium]
MEYLSLILVVLTLVIASGLSITIVKLLIKNADRLGVIDHPKDRSSHSRPTPRGGGMSFLTSFMMTSMLLISFQLINYTEFIPLLVCLPIVSLTGWFDDRSSLTARSRLFIQIICSLFSLALITKFYTVDIQASFLPIESQFVLRTLAILFFIWCINLYNFMDGIDGLAGSQAVFIALALAGFSFFEGEYDFMYLHLILASSVFGFILFNWSPAKIFMGDVGSYFLGFYFACMGVLQDVEGKIQMPTVGILMAPLIVDATFTLFSRLLQGYKLFDTHKTFCFHKIVQSGKSHKQVSTYYLLASIFWCLPMAILSELNNTPIRIGLWAISYVPLIAVCFYFKAGKKTS